jgi:Flp pilus assembly protein CpaB
MEMEYHDTSRRGRLLIILGVILAVAAGGTAFFLLNQSGGQGGEAAIERVPAVVAARAIAARKPIEPGDVIVRQVPVDQTNAIGVFPTVDKVIGRVSAVTILQGQLVTTNLLTSSSTAAFSILEPTETVGPDSESWRAVSVTVPADRAVGGLIEVGQTVDLFVTAQVNVPEDVAAKGVYYTDKSTKITYQDLVILARTGDQYIIKTNLVVAEEVTHLLATGNVQFSMALRPDIDVRIIDVSLLGATTNRIITKYGLPLPEVYPAAGQPIVTPPPLPPKTPVPTFKPAGSPGTSPGASPAPSGSFR